MIAPDLETVLHDLRNMADLLAEHVEDRFRHRDQHGRLLLQDRHAELILFAVYDVAARSKAARDLYLAGIVRVTS